MSDYKLSVIIPVYNVDKFLYNCLKSVANQTLKQLEVIIVNDGSTDGSLEIARSFEAKHNHFKVIHQQNNGRSAARNTGLVNAKGEYIAFVDGDDFISPLMYDKLYHTALERGSKLVKCGAVQFENMSGDIIKERRDFEVFKEILSPKHVLKAYLNNKVDNVVWNGIYHMSLFDEIRFPLDTEYEDHYVTPKLLIQSNRYIYIPESFYYYRKHPDSLTLSSTSSDYADKVKSVNELFQIITNHQLIDELSNEYSRYFYNMVIDFHNSVIYKTPWDLRRENLSVNNLIEPEVFDFVLHNNSFGQREDQFMKAMQISHFAFFLVQKLSIVTDILRGRETYFKAERSDKVVKQQMKGRHKKLMNMYA